MGDLSPRKTEEGHAFSFRVLPLSVLQNARRSRPGSESEAVSRSPHPPLLEQKPVNSMLCSLCYTIERESKVCRKAFGSSLSAPALSLQCLCTARLPLDILGCGRAAGVL